MRRPNRLMRELGAGGAIAFQIFLAANVLAALIHPLFMIGLGYTLFCLPTPWASAVIGNAVPIFATSLTSGYASTMMLDVIGLWRRGLLAHAWVLLFTPLHWFLLSFAAWRALFQLLSDPQRWEKTEHGLTKSSRPAQSRHTGSDRLQGGSGGRRNERRVGPAHMPARLQIGPAAPIAPIKLMQMGREGMPAGL